MKKLMDKINSFFVNRMLLKKIDSLEKEIEAVRELTTNNYWKLKKEVSRNGKKQKVVHRNQSR